MMWQSKEEVKVLARVRAEELEYGIKAGPLETLRTIRFPVLIEQEMGQLEMAKANLGLRSISCLGRAAAAAAVVEKHFPEANVQMAEVRTDYLAGLMLNMLADDPDKRHDPPFMRELLMYEEPHMAVSVNGEQFEPLSAQFGSDIRHPKVKLFPVWEAVAASVTVSYAWLEPDPQTRLNILEYAEKLCPGTTLVAENMCEPLEVLGRRAELLEQVMWCVKERPCARNLYVVYALTGEKKWYDELVARYSPEIVKYF
jgi:hypothetical protein